MQHQLDLTQYICPMPVLLTKQALENLPQGHQLIILVNYTSAAKDFELLCKKYNYQLISVESKQDYQKLLIKK
ncbi:sulfurtransferase TusA family protein [Mannheimia massilioguelmaensis]|uniref:sulfurtransferase TusA family protein n=1 Tax=Mannheimia massilioguelmaensis TaxID=1604354 RepID=UPI0005C99E4B|nr:sulfurtransferase TusA family protein [Mannheimia massilioguelmaensis]